MAQCRAALVPDGLFLAALLGGDTLQVGAALGGVQFKKCTASNPPSHTSRSQCGKEHCVWVRAGELLVRR